MRAKTEKDLWSYENGVYAEGYERLCGVDEAGRGPLAGPVCAAAVTLPRDLVIPGLDDSKKLTEKRREALFDVICREAEQYSVAFATVEEIEELNILGATYLAMNRAIAGLGREVQLALIDKLLELLIAVCFNILIRIHFVRDLLHVDIHAPLQKYIPYFQRCIAPGTVTVKHYRDVRCQPFKQI